jgi:amino acid transporter
MNAILVFVGISVLLIGGWAVAHLVGSGTMDPINFFAESSTMGTILVLLVYLLANLALPFYYKKYKPADFKMVRHGVLPILGALFIIVPLYYLAKPGQPTPYNWYPYIALVVVVLAVIYASVLSKRNPGLADRVGSIVADE